MNSFQKLQRLVLILWLSVVAACLVIVGHAAFLQLAGRTASGHIAAVEVWQPPRLTWPHYYCTAEADGRYYQLPPTIVKCAKGDPVTLKINPFDPSDADTIGDYLNNTTSLPWYVLGLSAAFVLAGLALRLTHHRDPWRTALNRLLDRLQGVKH